MSSENVTVYFEGYTFPPGWLCLSPYAMGEMDDIVQLSSGFTPTGYIDSINVKPSSLRRTIGH